MRKSNPWKGGKCGRPKCFPFRGERGETAGGKGSATPNGVGSVGKRWGPVRERRGELPIHRDWSTRRRWRTGTWTNQ